MFAIKHAAHGELDFSRSHDATVRCWTPQTGEQQWRTGAHEGAVGQLSPESFETSLPLAGVQGPVIRWPTKVSLYNNKQQQQVALLIVAELSK